MSSSPIRRPNALTMNPRHQQETLAMHRRYQSLLAFAAIVLSFASGPTWAADFTFTVPVELSNLPPDSRMGSVSCALRTSAVGTPRSGTVGVGNGRGTFTISGGAYRGEVTVTANANPGVDPATVTHYTCGLAFYATLRGSDHQFAYWLTAAPGPGPSPPPGGLFSPPGG